MTDDHDDRWCWVRWPPHKEWYERKTDNRLQSTMHAQTAVFLRGNCFGTMWPFGFACPTWLALSKWNLFFLFSFCWLGRVFVRRSHALEQKVVDIRTHSYVIVWKEAVWRQMPFYVNYSTLYQRLNKLVLYFVPHHNSSTHWARHQLFSFMEVAPSGPLVLMCWRMCFFSELHEVGKRISPK